MVKLARYQEARMIAELHIKSLQSSFLAKLGTRFLTSLYQFLIGKELVLVHTEREIVLGFVSASKDPSKMMKRFILHKPGSLFTLACTVLVKPGLWVSLVETFLAPLKTGKKNRKGAVKNLPDAELLSICIDPQCQGAGIGSQLVMALDEWLIGENISRYKVMVGQELEASNRFYRKNGFVLAGQVNIHGAELSNIYTKELNR